MPRRNNRIEPQGTPNNAVYFPRYTMPATSHFQGQANYGGGPWVIDAPRHEPVTILPGESIGEAAHRIFGSNTIHNRRRVRNGRI